MDHSEDHSAQATEVLQYRLGQRIRLDLDGELFEAFDTSLSRSVWIRKFPLTRIFTENQSHSDAVNAADQREAAIEGLRERIRKVAGLQHAAFVRIHNVEEVDDNIFVVMEAVTGLPLAQLDSVTANEALLAKYLFEVASALQEAHAIGLVHGDLKIENLVLDASGHIRILNFSLAPGTASNIFGSETQIDPFGSLIYTAPERFSQAVPVAASDLFALGVIWYSYFSQRLPFAGLHGLALVAAKLQRSSAQWEWPESMSMPMREILLRLTAADPSVRPSATELRERCVALIPRDMVSQSLNSEDLRQLREEIEQGFDLKKGRYRYGAPRSWKRYVIALGLVVILSTLTWKTAQYWPQVWTALKPYSSANEIAEGLNDLTEYQIRPRPAKLASAIQHFQQVIEREPRNAEAIAYLAIGNLSNYYASTRDEVWFQKATAGAQQAMSLAPEAAASLLAQARIQQGHHQLDLALQSVEKALQKEPDNLLLWHCKMSVLLEARKHEEAIKFGVLGAGKFPHDRYLLDLLGGIYLDRRDYQASIEVLEQSIRRQPESLLAYSLLSQAMYSHGKREEALAVIQKGLVIGSNVNLFTTLGNIRFEEHDFVAAATAYENAVSVNKGVNGSYLRWFQYAEALVQIPDRRADAMQAHQKAQSLLELRLKRSPSDPILTSIQAVIYARLGNSEASHQFIQKTHSITDLPAESYFWLALSYQILGEGQQANTALAESRRQGYDPRMIANYPDFKMR